MNETNGKLYQQVFEKMRKAILCGPFRPGMKLPPIRALASEMDCSRNTVETAYRLLVQEGYVVSRPGSGYIVQNAGLLHADLEGGPDAIGYAGAGASAPEREFAYDFTYGNLETGTFPSNAWRSITNDLLSGSERAMADVYGDPLGEMRLRDEIARQLNASRDIACRPEQIIVQGGTEASVVNLLALFDRENDSILMEDPGYNGIRDTFIRSGFRVMPIPVEEGSKTYIDAFENSHARLVFVTPSSQFPTCQVMPMSTRRRLIEWAEREGAYILEDDYCREFRYLRRPTPPLASMSGMREGEDGRPLLGGRVIYMGTFSKALSPALRMNYLVLPENLLERWKETFAHSYPAVPWLSQAVLARFMRSGQWDRHLRRMQAANRRKFETLIGAIRNTMGQRVSMRESGTGLHFLVDVLDGRGQDELIEAAAAEGVRVYGTSDYCMEAQPSMKGCILIGFSAISEKDIEPGIEALARAWFS